MASWVAEIAKLCKIAESQPYAAFAAFTHGVSSKWSYMSQVVPDIGHLLQPVEDVVRNVFLPILTGRQGLTDDERELISLPARLGGLGVANAVKDADVAHRFSLQVSGPLCALVALQTSSVGNVAVEQHKAKAEIRQTRRAHASRQRADLLTRLPPTTQRAVELASEKGASAWLTTLPLAELGFHLNKAEFRDGIALRYNWPMSNLPSHCVCGEAFRIEHALSCSVGGLPSLRHNHIRDLTASLLTEVAASVRIEPELLPLSGEHFRFASANVEDKARLDIEAFGFWGSCHERALFDVRVFNPFAPSNSTASLSATFRKHERCKSRQYQQRVLEVERASFTPLVFAATGGMAPRARVFFKRLCDQVASKRRASYSQTIALVRASVAFSLLRDAIACFRGARSSKGRFGHGLFPSSIDVAASESAVEV